MQLDQEMLDYIQVVVKTAEIAKLNNLIIEPGVIRGIDEDRTVFILDKPTKQLPFGSIGINRLATFTSRLDLIKNFNDVKVDVLVEGTEPNTYARSITLKGEGMKIDYRCANPATIQAPKAFNDTVKYHAEITADAVIYMAKGQSAMGADEVTLVSDTDGVSFVISDINSDKLVYRFADSAISANGDETAVRFSHRYPIKTVHTLFKQNPNGVFYLTARGMLKILVNGISVYVLPKA